MKQAIVGLRKRETYEELINDLNHDLITNYPDRRASELENSPYLSQLRGGFEEMIMHNDNLMKEKMKEMLLHEQAGQADVGRHEIAIQQNRWRPYVPPEGEEQFQTPERQPPTPSPGPSAVNLEPVFRFAANDLIVNERVARVPRMPQHYAPPQPHIQVSSTIQEAEVYNIGEKKTRNDKSRSSQRRKKRDEKMAQDVDPDIAAAHEIAIDDEEMQQQRREDLREKAVEAVKMMLEAASPSKAIDDLMAPHGEKRREEGANPKPAQPKAKTTKPKKESEEPEEKHEPKGKQGRPPNTQASSSTDVPKQPTPKKSPAKPKAEAAQEPKSKAKPVKKDAPVKKTAPAHDTENIIFQTPSNWKKRGKGFVVDQYNKRKIGEYLTKEETKAADKNDLIGKILEYDKKHSK